VRDLVTVLLYPVLPEKKRWEFASMARKRRGVKSAKKTFGSAKRAGAMTSKVPISGAKVNNKVAGVKVNKNFNG
jgi:hypothetical protein